MTPPAVISETYENRYTLPPVEDVNDTAAEILAGETREKPSSKLVYV